MADYQYVSNGMPDGAIFGRTTSSKLSFYGSTPVTQQSGGSAIATTALPTTVAANTTSGYGFTTTTDGATLLALVTALVAEVNILRASLRTAGLLS